MGKCKTCPFVGIDHVRNIVPGTGPKEPGAADIMLLGESPGSEDDLRGVPFIGRSGKEVLIPILEELRIARSDIWIRQCLRCIPFDDKVRQPGSEKALSTCVKKYLIPEIKRLKPKVIVALGTVPMKVLTGIGKHTKDVRGSVHEVTFGDHECIVIPTYQPSYCFPGRSLQARARMKADLQKAVRFANGYKDPGQHYTILDTWELVETFFEELSIAFHKTKNLEITFDLEGQVVGSDNKLNIWKDKILGIGLSWKEGHAVYIPLCIKPIMSYQLSNFWKDRHADVLGYLTVLLESPHIPKNAQNGSYDVKMIRADYGIVVENWSFDPMLASHNCDENQESHGLAAQTNIFLPEHSGYKGKADYADMASMAIHGDNGIARYCMEDADFTHRLKKIHEERLAENESVKELYHNYTMPLRHALTEMEYIGAPVNVKAIPKVVTGIQDTIKSLEIDMRKQFGRTVNADSTQDVLAALWEEGVDLTFLEEHDDDDDPIVDAHGNVKYKVDKMHLEVLEQTSPLAKLILDMRAITKLLGTYVTPIQRKVHDGRIHGSFLSHGTVSWRLASRNPNLQNIPGGGPNPDKIKDYWGKAVKGLYYAPKGYVLLQSDVSQGEVRFMAYYADDDVLAQACDKEDVHLATACDIYEYEFDEARKLYLANDKMVKQARTAAKSGTFLTAYGGSADAAAALFHVPVKVMRDFQENYFKKYHKTADWIKDVHNEIDLNKIVWSREGRPCRIPYAGQKGMVGRAHRQAVNRLIQGSLAVAVGRMIIRTNKRLIKEGYETRLILTVHDSIITLVPEHELVDVVALIDYEMTKKPLPDFNIPLPVDHEVGYSWDKLEPYALSA